MMPKKIISIKTKPKVAVAMSGGVDSSVTAALCAEKYGRENVFGVTMKLFCYGEMDAHRRALGASGEKSCCSVEAVSDAASVCRQIGIPHYALDLEKEFEEAVIKNFISEYKKGRTPIPCVPCNTAIKFNTLLMKVRKLGADFLATGHYARIRQIPSSEFQKSNNRTKKELLSRVEGSAVIYQLLRGKDKTKDQSYFLYGLNQDQLAHTLFPLGAMQKTEVRKLALQYGLKTAKKKESQGICFVIDERVTEYLADKIKISKGDIVDIKGKKIGEHDGIIFYTVGQRKRIGGGYAEPMYVVRINPEKNQVIIGGKSDLYQKDLKFESANWINPVKFPLSCSAKIRYNMEPGNCVVGTHNSKCKTRIQKATFKEPQRAVTPGQSIVFYDKDIVLGGGIITNSGSWGHNAGSVAIDHNL